MIVMPGVDYLSTSPRLLLKPTSETPILDALLSDDETMARIFGHRWYWTVGSGSDPIEWGPQGQQIVWEAPRDEDGRITCARCGKLVKPRDDGEPVRHHRYGTKETCK